MDQQSYRIYVETGTESLSADATRSLLQDLQETEGVVDASRQKESEATMDLGTIVTVVMTSGATLAVAQGIADWLRRRRGSTLRIERDIKSGSIKAEVENIDPATALRITEIISGA